MRGTMVVAGAAAVWLLTGCSTGVPLDPPVPEGVQLPPSGAGFDYQLGGAYEPPEGAEVVARDSTAPPAMTSYAICYVNGFQTQPGELADWPDALLLHDASGAPLIDPGWPDEVLLDTSTPERREAIGERIGAVIRGCADDGYDAVEIDNLDSYTRSKDALTIEHNIAMAAVFAGIAHEHDLAIAQKNGAGDSARFRDEAGFDFAVTEECMRYEECDDYLDAYDGLVFDIEYGSFEEFAEYCAASGHPPSMILRDLDLVPADDPAYVYETC